MTSPRKPEKPIVSPRFRINLASAVDADDAAIPRAGTVAVTFDGSGPSVALASNNDVAVNKAKMKVMFDLTTRNLPSGASAKILGVEFSKPNEPAGTYAPSGVFEDSSTFTDGQGNSHTVYGKWLVGKSELKLIDDNKVPVGGAEQDYGYRVWVQLTNAGSTSYYSSPDPEIKNEEPPPTPTSP